MGPVIDVRELKRNYRRGNNQAICILSTGITKGKTVLLEIFKEKCVYSRNTWELKLMAVLSFRNTLLLQERVGNEYERGFPTYYKLLRKRGGRMADL